MKKITRIICFILFILTLFTSISYAGGEYCVAGNVLRYSNANYHEVGVVRTLPAPYSGAIGSDFDNDYAKDYILSSTDYSEEEKQLAYYCAIGDENGVANELYYKAMEYQNQKLIEKNDLLSLTEGEDAKTFVSEGKFVYGPIYLIYPFGEIENEERRTWAGAYYTFCDEEGNNISDIVDLCVEQDGKYVEVSSTYTTSGTKQGYYKITSGEYSGAKLYISTSNRQLVKVYMRVCAFQKVRTAEVVRLEGTATLSSGYWFCDACRAKGIVKGGTIYSRDYTTYSRGKTAPSYPGTPTCDVCGGACQYTGSNFAYTHVSGGGHRWNSMSYCTYCGCQRMGASTNCPVNRGTVIRYYNYYFDYHKHETISACGKIQQTYKEGVQIGSWRCGQYHNGGTFTSQPLERVDEKEVIEEYFDEIEVEIELGSTIEITKNWTDYDNQYNIRPERLYFNVYRSLDQKNWQLLTENEDYVVTIENKVDNTWKILISGLLRVDDNGNEYYFKVEEKDTPYFNPDKTEYYPTRFDDNPAIWYMTINNTLKHINMSGYVWLDGQTGIKPAVPNNGIMDNGETKFENIVVYLYQEKPKTQNGQALPQAGQKVHIATTVTDKNGYFKFEDYEIGLYYVEFYYDGIHYEDTIKVDASGTQVVSRAFEDISNMGNTANRRNQFNARFATITYNKSNDGTTLNYDYTDRKSTLITNDDNATTIKKEFQMTAETPIELIKVDTGNLNLGLVNRGTDIALSTDVYDAKVTVNGQVTDYTYNRQDNNIQIGTKETQEDVSYNLNLYTSDYNYRIRDYVNTQDFQEKDYINDANSGIKSGDELRVYVTYELNLQNQSSKTTRINEVKYVYDEKYTYVGLQGSNYNVQNSGNVLTINLDGLSLNDGETKTLYLIFELEKVDNAVALGEFSNKAEITSYSTDEGLIDVDSQPGNFINKNQIEDDSDTAGGLTVSVPSDLTRKLTGKVFDNSNGQSSVNDVIVQLIELKTVNGKVFEYIWQETVSGTDKGIRLTADGTALETYSYNKSDGYYEFIGFIPGDYIVRFIYGDGTTYDMTGNVIKYNGQDYKSIADNNYKAEWYNSSTYAEGASVARDNEARRLETMAYSVEIDAEKGVLLKLLNNLTVDGLNETEKEIIIETYNKYYGTTITQVTDDIINQLLKEQVLKNTWMCAETSKIKVAIDTETITNTSTTTSVNGITKSYVNNINNINLGLELRPVTKIELKKYITGFKLVASNGQTLVNAYIDVNEYFNNADDISNKVEGLKDNVTILNNIWQYEVVPTDINTIVDGANLEFEYTLAVRNTGDTDYLSAELANIYNTSDVETYINTLTNRVAQIKGYIRNNTYKTQIGNSVGNSYYVGGNGEAKVLTEVTSIRDYINNDLTFVFEYEGKVEIDEDAPKTHRILRDDYSMQEATIDTILRTTESTGKMDNADDTRNIVMYTVTLGKNPISSTGNLSFENYIAEVMSYTNAAGRRAMTSTPGNAEIIDHEYREGKSHEIDEADTGRIQIGVATGDDETTNYIIIIAVAGGIALVAIGAYIVKKYFLK